MSRQVRRRIGHVALAAAIGGALVGHVFTESDAVGTAQAGSGPGTISGYAVSDVAYATEGDELRAVSFVLDAEAARVRIRVLPGGGWHDCGASVADNRVACTGLSERVADAEQLRVVASN